MTFPQPPFFSLLFLITLLILPGCNSEKNNGVLNTDTVTESDTVLGTDIHSDTQDSADNDPSDTCTINVINAALSETIGTVGIITWSSNLETITEAHIDFGPDTNYGLTAPVDLAEPYWRTLLLGMKENSGPYHFRITATSDSITCMSCDYTFDRKTDARPSDLELPEIITYQAEQLFGGFFITTEFRDNLLNPKDYAFILDGDGDLVWWYRPEDFGDLTVAHMSYDGKYMWLGHGNVPNREGHLGRVRMDGYEWTDRSADFPWLHHDFTILPDETVAYLSYNHNECDDIIEVSPDGVSKVLMNSVEALSYPIVCHGNAIQYSPIDDTYVISDTNWSTYFKIDRNGKVLWVLNGGEGRNQFDQNGGGATGWTANHNFHLLNTNRMLFFNNGSFGDANAHTPAIIREIVLDLDNMTTVEVWNYASAELLESEFLGDVQRLPNGNTIITYSASAIVYEVNKAGDLLQEMIFPQYAIGYATKRESLYGPPPR